MSKSYTFYPITVIYGIWLTGIVFFMYLIYLFWQANYAELSYQILKYYEKLDKILTFKERYFTYKVFIFLRYGLFALLLGWLLCYPYLARLVILWKGFNKHSYSQIKVIYATFKYLTIWQKYQTGLLFFIIALISLKNVLFYPLLVDEVFNYVFLSSKGFLVAFSYYPGPNNHIFYTLSVCFLDIFSPSEVLAIRLPAWLASMLALVLLFAYLHKKYYFSLAFWSVFLLALMPNFQLYSFLGRGYMFTFIFTLISIFYVEKILKQTPLNLYDKFLFITIHFLSIYTIPSQVYYYVLVFIVTFFYLSFKDWIIIHLSIIGLIVLTYSPILLLNGLGSITQNNWVKPIKSTHFFKLYTDYLSTTPDFFFPEGYGFAFLCLILSLSAINIYLKLSFGRFEVVLLGFLLCPFLVIFFQKLLPFQRIWFYMYVPLWFILVKSHYDVLKNKSHLILALCTFLILFLQSDALFSFYQPKEDITQNTARIIAQKPTAVWVNDDTYQVFLRYACLKKKSPTKIVVASSIDTLRLYDWLILDKKIKLVNKKPKRFWYSYHLHKQTPTVLIYRLKK